VLPDGVPIGEFLDQCEGKTGWSDPAPPIRIFGNVYDVGTCGIEVLLVAGDEGHVLIDGATAEAAPQVASNIERLGFKLADIKWIVTSHEHLDHAGGLAELQRRTGARLAVREAQRPALEQGRMLESDPQAGLFETFPIPRIDRIMADGEVLTLGNLALMLHATPGHSAGSTSWTWRSCEGATCRAVAYADSITAASNETYRFSDHPEHVATFRRSLDVIAGLDCEILLTPHPAVSQLYERLAGDAPLGDPEACRGYAQVGRENLDARLAREAAGR
jgi:metallo-beta-lactamase class B